MAWRRSTTNYTNHSLRRRASIHTSSGDGEEIENLLNSISETLEHWTGRISMTKFVTSLASLGQIKQYPEKTKDNSLQWNDIVAERYKSLGGSLSLANLRRILREDIINDDTNMINMIPAFPVVEGWTAVKRGGQGMECSKHYWEQITGRGHVAMRVKDDDSGRAMIIDFD
ncbi:hypothetical protein B0H13DRAFT_1892212 [Mycena leptocephala]|nr:hypothetical protein B0H13DRAFT_1892212 [Mycena leptocephala]